MAHGDLGASVPDSIDLRDLTLEDLRVKRRQAEKDEQDLSFVRRMLQGRIDIIKAELRRREGNGDELIASLSAILADTPSGGGQSQGRHVNIDGTNIGHPVAIQAHQALGSLSNVNLAAVSDAELLASLRTLTAHERDVSDARSALHKRIDGMGSELTRRYREGSAQVDDLLAAARRP